MPDDVRELLSLDALDERIAIVGTSGSGKTYAAKGFVERLLNHGTRMAIVDPLGVWWGLRASADAAAAGYPVVVFGGRHADVPIDESMGAALGRLIAREPLACVVDMSELGSAAARRRFMTAFAETVYEGNREPLHLVFDGAAALYGCQDNPRAPHVLLPAIAIGYHRGQSLAIGHTHLNADPLAHHASSHTRPNLESYDCVIPLSCPPLQVVGR
jgi:DNA helicase HerA-like ATPase